MILCQVKTRKINDVETNDETRKWTMEILFEVGSEVVYQFSRTPLVMEQHQEASVL